MIAARRYGKQSHRPGAVDQRAGGWAATTRGFDYGNRNTISRISSRIDELTERLAPNRGLITIVGFDEAECQKRLEEMEA